MAAAVIAQYIPEILVRTKSQTRRETENAVISVARQECLQIRQFCPVNFDIQVIESEEREEPNRSFREDFPGLWMLSDLMLSYDVLLL